VLLWFIWTQSQGRYRVRRDRGERAAAFGVSQFSRRN